MQHTVLTEGEAGRSVQGSAPRAEAGSMRPGSSEDLPSKEKSSMASAGGDDPERAARASSPQVKIKALTVEAAHPDNFDAESQ